MEITLTNQQVLNIHSTLANLGHVTAKAKTKYNLAKNQEILERLVKNLQKELEPPKEESITNFEKDQAELMRRFAVGPDGKPNVRENQQGQIRRVIPMSKQGEYMAAMEELQAKYPMIQELLEHHQDFVNETLEKSVTVDLRKINEIPEEMNVNQVNTLMPLIDESVESDPA
jgi:hypothetical protein